MSSASTTRHPAIPCSCLFARWAQARLPTEQEWEVAAAGTAVEDAAAAANPWCHPLPLGSEAPPGRLHQLYADVWQWTASAYLPYPGYRPAAGALGEYNSKFMVNQLVLRGGSCATPKGHLRPTCRNFFPARDRWQFMGIRLARDL